MATYGPSYPTVSAIPAVPALGGGAPNATGRAWLEAQLAPLGQMHQAQMTQIQAGAKQSLAGYGGYSFGADNPNTPQREDLLLNFNAGAGPGEREKGAIRGQVNQANAQGMLYSSFANQNIASAVQRLSLEAQGIATQYASSIMKEETGYAGQVSGIVGQWVGLYGADAAWMADHPPPTPVAPQPGPGSGVEMNTGPGTGYQGGGGAAPIPGAVSQDQRQWTGSAPPNMASLAKQWGVPRGTIRVSVVNGKYTAWLA